MPAAAPRLDPRLVERLEVLARSAATPADIRRALVKRGRELGMPPPSYEHVRRLVGLTRLELDIERQRHSDVLPVAVEVAIGVKHGNELVRVARGARLPTR